MSSVDDIIVHLEEAVDFARKVQAAEMWIGWAKENFLDAHDIVISSHEEYDDEGGYTPAIYSLVVLDQNGNPCSPASKQLIDVFSPYNQMYEDAWEYCIDVFIPDESQIPYMSLDTRDMGNMYHDLRTVILVPYLKSNSLLNDVRRNLV